MKRRTIDGAGRDREREMVRVELETERQGERERRIGREGERERDGGRGRWVLGDDVPRATPFLITSKTPGSCSVGVGVCVLLLLKVTWPGVWPVSRTAL